MCIISLATADLLAFFQVSNMFIMSLATADLIVSF
jgi:hypothetical protein